MSEQLEGAAERARIQWAGAAWYALIAVLAALVLLFALVGVYANSSFITVGSFILFVILALVAIGRFLFRGPEAARLQPVVEIGHLDVRIVNIDVAMLQKPEFQQFMKDLANLIRRPLPAPTGIMRGSSSDLSKIRELSAEEAEELRRQDNT